MDQQQLELSRPAYPGDEGVAADLPTSRTMAIWSLVMSVLPVPVLWPVSIGLGIAVLVRSRNGRDRGKTLVVVGFSAIAGWLFLFAVIIAGAVTLEMQLSEPERNSQGETEGEVWIDRVRVGDCTADDLPGGEIDLVDLVPCDGPHRLEAYAVFDLPAGPFPGQKDVDRLSEGGCTSRFEDFVGIPWDDSEHDFQFVTPIKEIWEDDRAVICFADPGGTIRGTLKNVRE
jgi:hypothetical protein